MNVKRSVAEFLDAIIPANRATYTAPATVPPVATVRGVPLTDRDMSTLRNVLFAEISNRNPAKQALEARTIINTALNRIPQYTAQQGAAVGLHDVLTMPNQYQGYGSPEYQRISNNATTTVDAPKLKAIDDTLNQMKSGNFPDTTGGRVFYHHDPQGQIILRDGTLYKQPTTTRPISSLIK